MAGSSSVPDRYTFESVGDSSERDYPKFQTSRLAFGRSSTPVPKTRSVFDHVQMLEQALQRYSNGPDAFDWGNGIAAYQSDLKARLEHIVFRKSRESLMEAVVWVAGNLLEEYVANYPLDEPLVPGHGWVLFLLEHKLDTYWERTLPKDGEGDREFFEEEVIQIFEGPVASLERTAPEIMGIIKQIHLSRKPTERFQFFDDGGEEKIEYVGSDSQSTEGAVNICVLDGQRRNISPLLVGFLSCYRVASTFSDIPYSRI